MSIIAKVIAAAVICGTGGIVLKTENPVKRAVHKVTAPNTVKLRPRPFPAAAPCVLPHITLRSLSVEMPLSSYAAGAGRPVAIGGVVPAASAPAAPVPEPAVWAQLIAGLGSVGAVMRARTASYEGRGA